MTTPYRPALDDFYIVRDDDQDITREYYADGEPVDLTGSTIVFVATWSGGSIEKSSEDADDIEIADPTNGRFVIHLSRAESAAFPLGKLTHYEIDRRIDGSKKTFLMGQIIGIGDVIND